MKKILAIALAVSALTGCASNPSIVQMSPDTYLLAKSDKAGIFGNSASFKTDVIREANAFAQAQGKIAIPLNLSESPLGAGRFASIEYQFRVVDKNDTEARRTALNPRADIVVENTTKAGQPDGSRDTYADLIRLDDLRKKGILSEAEFDAQKKKILGKSE